MLVDKHTHTKKKMHWKSGVENKGVKIGLPKKERKTCNTKQQLDIAGSIDEHLHTTKDKEKFKPSRAA